MKKFFAVVAVAAVSLGAVSCTEKKAEETANETNDTLADANDTLTATNDTLNVDSTVEPATEAPAEETPAAEEAPKTEEAPAH